MTANERAIKKQLLIIKGEALRIKLQLELNSLRRHPLKLAKVGLQAWFSNKRLSEVLTLLNDWLPGDQRGQRWLKLGARAWFLWQAGRKFWIKRS
ncbi:hypothetical protein HZU77_010025 [Neisseriaceae bacterium TC5R-5]|nr:hypothetical protein [Neisseriaceae bacterium TC5R-5]